MGEVVATIKLMPESPEGGSGSNEGKCIKTPIPERTELRTKLMKNLLPLSGSPQCYGIIVDDAEGELKRQRRYSPCLMMLPV
jgi:hypothetical protein